jgi:hypothetical protein
VKYSELRAFPERSPCRTGEYNLRPYYIRDRIESSKERTRKKINIFLLIVFAVFFYLNIIFDFSDRIMFKEGF